MDKKIMGMIAAIGSVVPVATAHASVPSARASEVMSARSFRELLEPISDAPAILKALDEKDVAPPRDTVQLAQHHHHHHHRRRHHHHYHHHHHHQNNYS